MSPWSPSSPTSKVTLVPPRAIRRAMLPSRPRRCPAIVGAPLKRVRVARSCFGGRLAGQTAEFDVAGRRCPYAAHTSLESVEQQRRLLVLVGECQGFREEVV